MADFLPMRKKRNFGRKRSDFLFILLFRVHFIDYYPKFERTSIVAAQMGSRIIAPLQYKGMMHSQFFEEWFEIRELAKGTVIVMDNASFHCKKRLYELAKQYNVRIIFLPPYSPELGSGSK